MSNAKLQRDASASLYRQIADSIMGQIHSGSFSFDVPICTESELMERFGVSRITVRHALAELEGQGILYRKRGVGSFVNPEIYQNPSASSRTTQSNPNRVFAFVLPFNIARTGLTGAFQEATNYFNTRGCFTSIYISGENGDNRGRCILERLGQMDVAGIAYYPFTNNIHLNHLNNLIFGGKPVVLMDLPSRCAHIPCVTSDNVGGERALMRHLTGLGHRRIAFLTGLPVTARETLGDRYSGYLLGLAEVGLKPDPELICTDMNRTARTLPPEDGRSLTSTLRRFIDHGATAVVCEHDEMAYYVLQCCKELGIRVPEDLSVCGFDDNEWTTLIPDRRTTTVAQDWPAIGHAVAELLYDGLDKPLSVHAPIVVPTRFIAGNTSGPAPER